MTNEQIIELANQAGITFITKSGVASATEEWLVGFAQLVRNEVLDEAAEVLYGHGLELSMLQKLREEIRSMKK